MACVLVIDDDLMLTRVLEEHLTNEGFQVISASMVEEGITKAIHSQPDLIMLDVQLPDATGFQACGMLKQDPRTRSIPIIMMTGSARDISQQNIGRRIMGASDYILKPFNVIEVGERVRSLLETSAAVRKESGSKEAFREMPKQEILNNQGHETLAKIDPLLKKLEYGYSVSTPVHVEPLMQHVLQAEPEKPPAAEPTIMGEPQIDLPLSPVHEKPRLHVEVSAPAPSDSPEEQYVEEEKEVLLPSEEMIYGSKFDLAEKMKILLEKPFLATLPWIMFPLHLVLAMAVAAMTPKTEVLQTATYVAGGWALLLGLLTAGASVLEITLDTKAAVEILSLSAVPIAFRSFLRLVGTIVPSITSLRALTVSKALPTSAFWLRPLDIFEMAAMALLCIGLHRQPGSTLKKCLIAAVSVALAWSFTSRGYFRPF